MILQTISIFLIKCFHSISDKFLRLQWLLILDLYDEIVEHVKLICNNSKLLKLISLITSASKSLRYI